MHKKLCMVKFRQDSSNTKSYTYNGGRYYRSCMEYRRNTCLLLIRINIFKSYYAILWNKSGIRGNKRDFYDFLRFDQLVQTDFLFQFVDPAWMNDSLLIGLYLTFFQSLWSSCQAFDAPKNIKDLGL